MVLSVFWLEVVVWQNMNNNFVMLPFVQGFAQRAVNGGWVGGLVGVSGPGSAGVGREGALAGWLAVWLAALALRGLPLCAE